MDLNELTIQQAAEGLRRHDFTSVDLTKACLARIKERNEEINAFITVDEEGALAQAAAADTKLQAGDAHMLCGIPYGVKDAICTADLRATGGGKILDNYTPHFDATVIRNIRETGAVLLGKQNCDAFGHGASNENSMYGPVRNPHDTSRVAGGSSGGSAAAVADNMCLFSIAEDTGGSIRQPAALCGVVGLRPSYGRNSRYGIMPMASSLDTVGPMAKTVHGVALVQQVMAGQDPHDATTVPDEVPEYLPSMDSVAKGLTIGVPKEYFEVKGMDEETAQLIKSKLAELEKAGAKLVEVSLPYTKYAIPTYYTIVPSEDSSNLARLDGIRYGVRGTGDSLTDVYGQARAQGFPEEVKRRIMIGTYALSAGYYDAYYKKAQKVRTLIRQDFDTVFNTVDVLITPTSPTPAFDLGSKTGDPIAMYLTDVFVSPSAVAGIPGISVPIVETDGLPVGLQVLVPRLQEQLLFQTAHAVEHL